MSDPLRVVIGYDEREAKAAWVLQHSILKYSSRPINFTFLYLPALEKDNLMWRERDPKQSTDFSYSRFLTPYLSGYKGQSIFMDCDMLVKCDVAELTEYCPQGRDVAVVKHDYKPGNETKFLGMPQSSYSRKLWSAIMVFNCNSSPCQRLTPRYVNEATGAQLHQFKWITERQIPAFSPKSDEEIVAKRVGEIPEEYQWIPGHSDDRIKLEDARIIHFTEFAPWFDDYQSHDSPEARMWHEEAKEAGVA